MSSGSEYLGHCQYLVGTNECGYLQQTQDLQKPSAALESILDQDRLLCIPALRTLEDYLLYSYMFSPVIPLDHLVEQLGIEQRANCDKRVLALPGDKEERDELTEDLFGSIRLVDRKRILEIPPGITVIGFRTLDQVNYFTNDVSDSLYLRGSRLNPPLRAGGLPTNISVFADREFNRKDRKRFNGKVDNIRVTIIPPDLSIAKKSDNPHPDLAFSHITAADLHSTGKGRIGTLLIESTYYYAQALKTMNHKIVNRILMGESGVNALDRLMEESGLSHLQAQMAALRNVASAGLPSLGRR